jgi:hypothetical protein
MRPCYDTGIKQHFSAAAGLPCSVRAGVGCRVLTGVGCYLRAGAQVLADPGMRREVVPGLPLHRVCQLLQRFQPDDSAPDPLPPGAWGAPPAAGRLELVGSWPVFSQARVCDAV